MPFRNAHFLSVAVSWAEVLGAARIYIGAVEQDSSGYPDCRPAYYQAFNQVIKLGTKDGRIEIVTPLIQLRKSEIVRLGLELGAPFDLTWSCYSREDSACGVCDSCVLRLRAFPGCGQRRPDSLRGAGGKSLGRAGPECRSAKLMSIAISFVSREAKNMKQRLLMVDAGGGGGSAVRTPGVRPGHRDGEGCLQGRTGTPIVGANLEWMNTDNGRKYNLKTNKKGEYFSLGIETRQVQGHAHPGRQATGSGHQFSRGNG